MNTGILSKSGGNNRSYASCWFYTMLGTLKKGILLISAAVLMPMMTNAQVNEDRLGAWYMYFFDTTFRESAWGVQGDVQYRNWNIAGDLEQLLLRGGLTFSPPKAAIKFTLGYGNITTGTYGSGQSTTKESRVYQEALFPTQLGRFFLNHRFRYEQRFVENQDFRTRYRYNLFVNIPLNAAVFEANTLYLAFYNELFINGQRAIGNGNEVGIFDRNRLYMALGYFINPKLKVQFGIMNQTTDNWAKNQLQFSLHHKI